VTTAARSKVKSTEPAADPAEIRRALDLLAVPGGVVELRAIKIPGHGKPHNAAGYFTDLDTAAQAAATLDRRKAAGVYVVLNEINPALLARSPNQTTDHLEPTTSDGDIIRRRWFPLDFDPKRPAGISSTNAEHDAAEAVARECADWLREDVGWPDPVLADSGNGWHLLYRVDLPNDEAAREIVKGALAAIGARFTGRGVDVDQAVFNAARIFKVYSTTARKGHHTADRPHRLARLVDVPSTVQVVPQAKLEALAATVAKPAAVPSASGNGHGQPFPRLDIVRWLTDRGVAFRVKARPTSDGRMVYLLEHCPFDSGHGGSGEVSVMQGADGKLSAACMHNSCSGRGWQEFKKVIGEPDAEHYDPPLSDHRNNGAATDATGKAGSKPAERRKPIDYHPMTCAELIAAKFDIRFLAEQILIAEQPFLVSGPPKVLKTSLLVDMALSLATAGYFLGRFRVPVAVAVGIMSAESGLATLKETIQRVAQAAHVDPSTVHNLIISDRVPQIASLEHLDAVATFLDRFGLKVLAIDPAYMAMDGTDAGNLFLQGQQLRPISELCQERGVTLILCHHCKKAAGVAYEPLDLASIAWSGFAEFSRQWLLVNRREPYIPGTGTHRLWLSVGGSVGHGGLWGVNIEEGAYTAEGGRFWQVEVLDPSEVKAATQDQREAERQARAEERTAATLDSDRRALVKILTKLKSPETKTAIRARAAFGYERFGRAFANLVEDGTIRPVKLTKGKGQHVYEAWRLKTDHET
jgi:hypothetical protein